MKKTTRILLSLSFAGLMLSSCDNVGLFDYEGDCPPEEIPVAKKTMAVQFVFKKHRQALQQQSGKETDAFYATVPTVHLFVYDNETGALVYDQIESTDNLKSEMDLNRGTGTDKCFMELSLDPGKYRLVAWCGLDENDENNAFSLTGNKRASGNVCSVKRHALTGHPVNDDKYDNLYHGRHTSAEVTDTEEDQIFPVELTKNNNDINVLVQHTTANLADGDYTVVYTDANGEMDFHDNSLTDNSALEYNAFETSILNADMEYNGSMVQSGALVAHLSTSRLLENHSDDARLEVRNRDGKTVFSIPFIKYVMMMQTLTNDQQYYLDCEDTYNCTFFLTGAEMEDGAWIPMQIIINNWAKVPDQNGSITGSDKE